MPPPAFALFGVPAVACMCMNVYCMYVAIFLALGMGRYGQALAYD